MTDWVAIAKQRVVISIGQLEKADAQLLDQAVRRGEIAKWRGYWHPVPGASWGIGSLKTCYGPAIVE